MRAVWVVTLTLAVVGSAWGQQQDRPLVHSLFTSGMVLQRDQSVPVWGWDKAGTDVSVAFAGQSRSSRAGEDGRWQVTLESMEASATGAELVITGSQEVRLENVLVGDVWICSGQSNMEWSVAMSKDADAEIAAANHPEIRLFTVPKRVSFAPERTVDGAWSVCHPDTAGSFSAVAYYFGRTLQGELEVPIGLVHTSWGGTVAEAWTSAGALQASLPEFAPQIEQMQQHSRAIARGTYDFDREVTQWWQRADPQDVATWASAPSVGSGWRSMTLPVPWEQADVGLDAFDGIVWFRKTVDVPSSWVGRPARINLGAIDDVDTTYVNGHRVGGEADWTKVRSYDVPAGVLKAGVNVIAVRVFDNNGGGGIYDQTRPLTLSVKGEEKTLELHGEWQFRVAQEKSKLPPFPQSLTGNPNQPSVLFNGMLAPLVPFGIRGAIWYQGESNAFPLARAYQYRRLLPTLIKDWRAQFGQGDFPFLVVQLANFMQQQELPVESGWAELREAQQLTARREKQVGLVVTTDVGEANDIHPRDKQSVGRRLALQALRMSYGREVVASGPTLRDMSILGDALHLEFGDVGGGLQVHGDELRGFAVAEAEGEFRWAEARIRGNTVVVSHPDLAEPIRVRYNWANNPIGNLFNAEGLPAAPFRTDVASSPPAPKPARAEVLPMTKPESVGMSGKQLDRVTETLQQFVDDGRVAGAIVMVARDGQVVLHEAVGHRDREAQLAMEKDSILRFYSMTKAVTSVAVMMLIEEGKLSLEDPIEKYLPAWKGMQVMENPDSGDSPLVPPTRRATIRDLLRHTSGLTYGFFSNTPLDRRYRSVQVLSPNESLGQMADKLAQLPLLYQPGTRFQYGVSTDVLGHLVELVSETPLDAFFQQRVFGPLGMVDTAFSVPADKVSRFANNYGPRDGQLQVIDVARQSPFLKQPTQLSGGGGLVSTAADYMRFCQMLLNGGELGGKRLLQAATIKEMTRNQLAKVAYPISLNGRRDGTGFGLGFSVVVETTAYTRHCRVGEFGWGGAASTHYWISPQDRLAVVVLSQIMPFTKQLEDAVKPLVYAAIEDE